ncbi:hypothetical protein GCM10027174_04130 [Salinifilum aidingensis]
MTGTLRDPDNMRDFLREAVKGTRWEGCTRMPSATWSPPNSTGPAPVCSRNRRLPRPRAREHGQDVYMNRKTAGSSAATALDGLARRLGEQK